MAERLVRFGVAMEESLLQEFDELVDQRGGTRSEALRDLARAAVVRAKVGRPVRAVAALTLVYDHHVRDLTEKLTALQHELGDDVRSTMHVHLDHNHCMEVIVMNGRSDKLRVVSDKILAMRGVKHGGVEIITEVGPERRSHEHAPAHSHPHDHEHERAPAKPARKRRRSP
jgi:CopG family transcriptional regulator, nickel-responsive regulator